MDKSEGDRHMKTTIKVVATVVVVVSCWAIGGYFGSVATGAILGGLIAGDIWH